MAPHRNLRTSPEQRSSRLGRSRQAAHVPDDAPTTRVGYGRGIDLDHRDHNPDGHRDALLAAGWHEVFIDKASGKLASPPEADKALMIAARGGDQLVITKLGSSRTLP